ncbi:MULTISPECIES: hypothetical protein [unclassified Rhizobium]|uniref:hypothetical protein n=1 Tax=unclassified Rhizobium TaxID=2613769 RepID=UPI001781B72B|nr:MULTISPECIES: hypothetical protein [unclassified Rhizobium]MBD8686077.1 hypothetical protein [Rhizobium sp. CFBP 13644]MBD8690250.1 hypothetical protein [Rhizobium sp. CFBP 13717]
MKALLANLLGGVFAAAAVWGAQRLGASFLLTGIAAFVGAFVGTYAGQKLIDKP